MARKHNEIARPLEKNALTAQQISGLVGAGAGGLGGYLSTDDKASFGDRAFRTLGGAALGGGAGYGLGHFIPQGQAAQAAGRAAPAAPAAQVAQKAEQAAVQRAGQIHVPAGANLSAGGVSAAAPTMGLSGTASAPRSAPPAARASAPAAGTAATALAPAAAPEVKNPVFGSVEDYIAHSNTMPVAQDRARAAFNNPQVPRDYNSLQSAFALHGASPKDLQAVLSSGAAANWEKNLARDLLSQKAVTPATAPPGLSSIGRPGMAQASGRSALRPAKGFMEPGAGRVFSESPIQGGTRVNVRRNDAQIEAAQRARAIQQDEPALRSALEDLAAQRQARQQIPLESATAMPGESLGLSSIGRPGMAQTSGRTALRPTRGFMEPGASRVFSEAPIQGGTRVNVQRNSAPATRAAVAEGGPAAAALAPARPPVQPPPLPGSAERPIPLTDADMVMPPARPPVRPPPLPGSTERPIPLTDADMVLAQPPALPGSAARPIPLTEADIVGQAAGPAVFTPKESPRMVQEPSVMLGDDMRDAMAAQFALETPLGLSSVGRPGMAEAAGRTALRPSQGFMEPGASRVFSEAPIQGGTRVNLRDDAALQPALEELSRRRQQIQQDEPALRSALEDLAARRQASQQIPLESAAAMPGESFGLSSIGRPGMAEAAGRTALRPSQGFMEPGASRVFSEAPIQGGTRVNVRRNDAQLEAAERARQQIALRESLKTPFEGPRFSGGAGRVSGLEGEAVLLENEIRQRAIDEQTQQRNAAFLQRLGEIAEDIRAKRGLPPRATKFGSLRDSSRLKAAAQHSALLQFGLGALSPVTSFQFRA